MGIVFQNSPGVAVREIDLTTVVPAAVSSEGAFAGAFRWGPMDQIVTLNDTFGLERQFHTPGRNGVNRTDFLLATSFLAYSGALRVVRVGDPLSYSNATSSGAGINIKNDDVFDNRSFTSEADAYLIAKFPGALGNSIQVQVVDSATFADPNFLYRANFEAPPSTSSWAVNNGKPNLNDELHVVVIDSEGLWTGIPGTILETFGFVSRVRDAKSDDNESSYIGKVITRRSRYIRFDDADVTGVDDVIPGVGLSFEELTFDTFDPIDGDSGTAGSQYINVVLAGGEDGFDEITDQDRIRGYDLFIDADSVEIGLMIAGAASTVLANYLIENIAEARKDIVVFVSPPKAAVVDNFGNEVEDTIAFRNDLPSSSYAVMDSGWKYTYDKYNDEFIYIPLNADVAGLCARVDRERDPWFSPAGFNRGSIKNVFRLAYSPNKAQRDDLFRNAVNPIVDFPNLGVVLFGDKTLLARPSAFGEIGVRRMFIILEKSIARAARFSLFEFNDEFTRARFKSIVEPFLRDVQGRRGITDFLVVCDETNNTPQVIDTNNFIGDIYIKPARSIRFITLNFVAVPTGVAFNEIVGQF